MVCRTVSFDSINGLNEQNRTWRNWNEDVEFRASEYFEPAHSAPNTRDGLAQLVHVVARASEEGRELHAIGSGWAFEGAAASKDWIVSLQRLNRPLDYVVGDGAALTDAWRATQSDPDASVRLVHVEAGIRVLDLCEFLDAQGLAAPTLGGANGQALAGVVSTSTHGGDWQQPPFPDLVRAVHLVTEGGQELWVERLSDPITQDDRLKPRLPCADTRIVRDDRIFDAVLVACGRFGVIYSLVLQVRKAFRVVEVINRPQRSDVLQALRDGQSSNTLFGPLFAHLNTLPVPPGLTDATGNPYFLQILFNSQNPDDVWVHRRWETSDTNDLPVPPEPDARDRHREAVAIVAIANAALLQVAASSAILAPAFAIFVFGLVLYLDGLFATRNFRFGSVVAAALDALWKVPLAGFAVPHINFNVINGEFTNRIATGRRGQHCFITTGTRAGSDQNDFRADSIEVIFDATTADYLNFLDEVLPRAHTFQQAGIIALRPSRRSRALLSMHSVSGSHAISIEIATLKFLPGNLDWMRFVHQTAVKHNGRPHWGQFNKLRHFEVEHLYRTALTEWKEALLKLSGESRTFSNAFTRDRGLEPTSIPRQVKATRKTLSGVITHLCNAQADWSPVEVGLAIRQIETGAAQYFTLFNGRIALVSVVDDDRAGKYLRSCADSTQQNNLDSLPDC